MGFARPGFSILVSLMLVVSGGCHEQVVVYTKKTGIPIDGSQTPSNPGGGPTGDAAGGDANGGNNVANPTPGAKSTIAPRPGITDKQVTIISDVDDTIKVTGVKTGTDMPKIALELHEFSGLSKLYNFFYDNIPSNRNVYYVSGVPNTADLYKLTILFLVKYFYPKKENLFHKVSIGDSTYDYKILQISNIIKAAPQEMRFVLIGDNGEQDDMVYWQISKTFPDRIMKVFIHEAYLPNKATGQFVIHSEHTLYFTSVDLALDFYALQLIDESQIDGVLAVASPEFDAKPEKVVPTWMNPPCIDFMAKSWPTVTLSDELKNKVLAFQKKITDSVRCR